MVFLILGFIIIVIGLVSAVFIFMGVPGIPSHDTIWVVAGGGFFVWIGWMRKFARSETSVPFTLAGLSAGLWAFVVTEIVAQLIVENWAFVLAFALAQAPIVSILISKTYGAWARSKIMAYMKDTGDLDEYMIRIGARLVSQLPIEESAVYSIQASAISTALFMNQFGMPINSATTAAFLCATIVGTVVYMNHASVSELRAFIKNPTDEDLHTISHSISPSTETRSAHMERIIKVEDTEFIVRRGESDYEIEVTNGDDVGRVRWDQEREQYQMSSPGTLTWYAAIPIEDAVMNVAKGILESRKSISRKDAYDAMNEYLKG